MNMWYLYNMFEFILSMNPFIAVSLLAFFISLVITLAYKFLTDQNLMKSLKNEIKELQKEMKTLKDKPDKMMKVQRQMMETNMKYMTQSMKATLYTMIPIIIIFSWMSGHFAFEAINSQEEFIVEMNFESGVQGSVELVNAVGLELESSSVQPINADHASWKLKGDVGEYLLLFKFNENTYEKEIIISDIQEYAKQLQPVGKDGVVDIQVQMNKLVVFPWEFSWNGWLFTYIVMSIFFSTIMRKLLKIY